MTTNLWSPILSTLHIGSGSAVSCFQQKTRQPSVQATLMMMFPSNFGLSAISCSGLDAVLMVSVKDEVDITVGQV